MNQWRRRILRTAWAAGRPVIRVVGLAPDLFEFVEVRAGSGGGRRDHLSHATIDNAIARSFRSRPDGGAGPHLFLKLAEAVI